MLQNLPHIKVLAERISCQQVAEVFSDSLTISSAPPWKMTIRWPPSGNPLQCTRVKALPLTTYEYL
jgi:hypothetical protein